MSNLNRHVWEGWTVQDFIDELEPLFDMMVSNSTGFGTTSFDTDNKLKQWCMDNQPYYKKHIPEVFDYFRKKKSLVC